jgi:phosphatidate cytidylyltransferase
MLKTRVLTALVLAAIILAAMAWSPLAVAAVLTVAFAIAQAEWLQLAGWRFARALPLALALGVVLMVLLIWAPQRLQALSLPAAALAVAIWLALAVVLARIEAGGPVRIAPALSTVLAFVLPLAAWLAAMRFLAGGILLLFSVLAIVWIADIAAYFAGRAFGRAKLAVRISPGKTWAGVWGAMGAVALCATAFWFAWPQAAPYTSRLVAARGLALTLPLLALLVAFSIVGDLFESWLKRQAGAKDSGHLLPGHGGFYDRIDAMLALLPPAALIWLLLA